MIFLEPKLLYEYPDDIMVHRRDDAIIESYTHAGRSITSYTYGDRSVIVVYGDMNGAGRSGQFMVATEHPEDVSKLRDRLTLFQGVDLEGVKKIIRRTFILDDL